MTTGTLSIKIVSEASTKKSKQIFHLLNIQFSRGEVQLWVRAEPDDNDLHQLHRLAQVISIWHIGNIYLNLTSILTLGQNRYFGGFSASLSSAIASMVGAPRILQVGLFVRRRA